MKRIHLTLAALAIAGAATVAGAQSGPPAQQSAPPSMGPMPMHHPMGGQMGSQMGGRMGTMMAHSQGQQASVPAQSGEAAFGAIQEIVEMLQADPKTDWSKVDIDALRQHLIDMDEVTLRAAAQKEPIDNGMRIRVTGSGRTLEAIQRMVPDHAGMINGMNGWAVKTTAIPDGVELTVTAINPADVPRIRALGFMGIMVQGGHHQVHHLAMAKGEAMHTH